MPRLKKKEFHLSFKVVLRLIIFFILLFVAITYFSSQNNNRQKNLSQNVLGVETTSASDIPLIKMAVDNLYNQLPPESRHFIENLNQSPLISMTQSKIDFIKTETGGFPQKQLNDLKRYLLQKAKDTVNKAADSNK